MAKTENTADTQSHPDRTLDAKRSQDDLVGRVAQAEEFRERAERWMKEVTQQVARLAAQGEQDEKRRAATDRRIVDIEERLKSLLTLTELVSLDKNPFAAPRPTSAPAMDQPAAGNNPAAPTPEPAQAPALQPQRTQPAAPLPVLRAHPNDAQAERAPPPIQLSDEVPESPPATGFRTADPETRRRLAALAWADLLASASPSIDIASVAAFYEETGWLDAPTVRDAKRLADRLRGTQAPRFTSERELHEETIRLFGRAGIGPRAMDADARHVPAAGR